jgi:hypothetical protein
MRKKPTVAVLKETVLCLFVLCSGMSTAAVTGAETAPATLAPRTNEIPKSVFSDDEQGRDPFFPKSTRRQLKPAGPDAPKTVGPASLVLLGIIGEPERRIALINNQSFAAGEEQSVRVPGGGSAVIKCVEIRERSVMVTIHGGTELFELEILERTLPIAPDGQGVERGRAAE